MVVPQFPTHIRISKNRYQKVSGNALYSGLHRAIRHKMFTSMHDFLMGKIPDGNAVFSPVTISFRFYVPINYGDVRYISKTQKLIWHPPEPNYIPRWDVDNLAWPWIKAVLDTLVKKMVIENDTVEQVQSIQYQFIPCEHLDQRKLVISIKTLTNVVD